MTTWGHSEKEPICKPRSQFSSVVSDSLRPHGLQHTRPPCLSPTPRVYSNSCPLSQSCHPTISSSVVPFSSRLQSFPASESSNESVLCHMAKVLEFQLQPQIFQWTLRTDFLQDELVGSPCSSRGPSRVFSNTTVQKHQFFGAQLSLTITFIHDYWKNHSLDELDLSRQNNVSAFEYI